MWLTSNSADAVAHGVVLVDDAGICTGMSHPPKSTILAPSERWTALRQVAFKAAVAGIKLVL